MAEIEKDAAREERLYNEITVDAYGPEEQAISWYYYLRDTLNFPFAATCIAKRTRSPLRAGEQVTVTGMPGEAECEHEMFVMVQWQGRELAVPLAQLAGVQPDEATDQAIADWHYWVDRGYQL